MKAEKTNLKLEDNMPKIGNIVMCFGDIHGHLGAAKSAVSIAEEMNVPAVFLGDYVDRGPDSFGVLELIIEASLRHPDWVFLLGNHDLMLMNVIEGIRHPDGYDERTFYETLPMIPADLHMPIRDWLLKRPFYHRRDACIFVHGGFSNISLPIEYASREDLVWSYGIPEGWQGETVIRGHALVEHPELHARDININTRCGFGGYLTGLLLDSTTALASRIWKISENGELLGDISLDGTTIQFCK